MNTEKFEEVVDKQIDLCRNTLVAKAREYATDGDRLHNFKVAAELEGKSVLEALAGMMAKHTVSIYDMCREEGKETPSFGTKIHPLEQWDEKIKDHINYLLLLRAAVQEGHDIGNGNPLFKSAIQSMVDELKTAFAPKT